MTTKQSNDRVIDIKPRDYFHLNDEFVAEFEGKQPQWGSIGYVTYKRTYARKLPGGGLEEFWQTCRRVVEGVYTIQKWHCHRHHLPWKDKKAQISAQEMFRLMWDFKFLPPGRGLEFMGTDVVWDIGGGCLNNCGFVSTKDIAKDFSRPFTWLMNCSMLGIGVGFDTRGANTLKIQQPIISSNPYVVEDSREGWVDLLKTLLDSFVGLCELPSVVDYSNIRALGVEIKRFGGTSPGPQPLVDLFNELLALLNTYIGKSVDSTLIVDIGNLVGKCVVSGGKRRTAEIVFGSPEDTEFLLLKDPVVNEARLNSHGWTSNNSIFSFVGQDYSAPAEMTAANGEPGYEWLENARAYSRMVDPPDYKDKLALGGNPCQPANATILTREGIRYFKDIDVGSQIWSGSDWTTVTKKWSTGIKPVYKFHTRAGIFLGTENHRVVSGGLKVEVKDAETIDICTGAPSIVSALNPKDIMDGLVIGDGTVHKASNNLVLLLVGKDDQDWLGSEVSQLFGRRRPGVGDYDWEVDTTIGAEELGLTFNRVVPDRFFMGDELKVRGFLRGLYSANGSLCGNRVTLKAASFSVILSVQQMLSFLGIRSYYTVNKANKVQFSNGEYECKQSYDLNITTDRYKFHRLIGFIQKYKTEKLLEMCETVKSGRAKNSYEIVEKEYVGDQEVFDITVECNKHTYWTGGLLVSNCLEQTLENIELCCLVETFPSRHSTYEEYQRTLKFAYLYAKTVTLVPTHDQETNQIMAKNRRIGNSMSGIVQAFKKFGRREFLGWCDKGYKYIGTLDKIYSNWLGVSESIKKTSVKPSGTVSLLPGVTPGIHYPHSEYYYRVIRFTSYSEIVTILRKAGYQTYDLAPREPNTTAVYFPVKEEHFDRSEGEVSMWEQLENAAQIQAWWADNQVSVTIKFTPEESSDIKYALELYETRLKGVSFLPKKNHGYSHAPYQRITKEEYETYSGSLSPYDLSDLSKGEVKDKFCDGDKCTI